MATFYYNHESELYHYGVLGMHWGVRRYQNKDGSLTAAGKRRYSANDDRLKKLKTKSDDQYKIAKKSVKAYDKFAKAYDKAKFDKAYRKSDEYKSVKKEAKKNIGTKVFSNNAALASKTQKNVRKSIKYDYKFDKKTKGYKFPLFKKNAAIGEIAINSTIVNELSKEGRRWYLEYMSYLYQTRGYNVGYGSGYGAGRA